MQRGFKFGALLAAIMLLCVGGSVDAQENQTSLLYLDWLGILPESQEIYDGVEPILRAEGINVFYANPIRSYFNSAAWMSIIFHYNYFNTSTCIELVINEPDTLDLSPVLRPKFFPHIFCPLVYAPETTDSISQVAIDVIVGVSLYISGNCAAAIGYLDDAEELATSLLNTGELSGNVLEQIAFYRAMCAIYLQDYQTAITLLEPLLQSTYVEDGTPVHTEAVINLAWVYLQLGDTQRAFELADIYVDGERGYDAYFRRAYLYYEAEFYPEAIADVSTSINRINENMEMTPSDEPFWYARLARSFSFRAQLYALIFRYDDAIADMNSAIENDPDNPELYVLRANITLLIYEWDRVLADYNTALELDPDYADAYFYRGVFYYTRTEYQLALDDLNHYLELAPDGIHAAAATTHVDEINTTLDALGDG